MCAIHDSRIKYHGNLASCISLIRHWWVVQVSNFVLREFKRIRGNKKGQVDEELWSETIFNFTMDCSWKYEFFKGREPQSDVFSFRTLKLDLLLPQTFFFICFNESPSKMMKNAFHFILKALFVLKWLKFLSGLFVQVENVKTVRLD